VGFGSKNPALHYGTEEAVMKNSWLWDEVDIKSLIANGVQESLTLDYKRCDSLQKSEGKKREISKDVSAFANSAGGTIVYGVEEDKHLPTGIDMGYDPHDISKEWLEQVINSTIERRIDSIQIKEISLSGPKAGKSIYVVHIPQSLRAPHMAADNRFYKRFNFESVAMEEYEVRDVARRLAAPDLYIAFRHEGTTLVIDPSSEPPRYQAITVQAVVGNKSPAATVFSLFTWCVDARLRGGTSPKPDNSVLIDGKSRPVFSTVMEWRGTLRLPIWEAIVYRLGDVSISLPTSSGPYYLFWEAHAPEMQRKAGVYRLGIDKAVLTLQEDRLDWGFEKEVYRQV